MSYESTVLALTPILYWRLDEQGTATNGDVITDLSGNGLDGTLDFGGSSPIPPYGNVSPIESDPDSRSIFINNFPLPFTSRATVSRASDSLLEIADDITVMCWFRPDGLGKQYFAKEKNFDGTCYHIAIDSSGRWVFSVRDSAGTVWTVTAPRFSGDQNELIDSWWFVVGVRLGDALSIYVNAQLRATTTITSSLSNLTESGPLRLKPEISGGYAYFTDELAILNYAASGAQITAVYESAFNDLLARAECNITTTAVIRGSTAPDPITYPFRHNWDQRVVERLSWKSSVFKPTDGATELARQRVAPRRTLEYQHLLYNEELRRRYEARAFGGRTAITQFEPDKVQVAALAAGATSATFDTTLKDFEVGYRVLFYQDDDTYEYSTLTVVGDSGIEWEDPLTRDYTNVWVKPARVARMQPQTQMDQVTDTVGDSSTIYALDEADEPLVPRRVTPYTSTLTYRSRDLWDLREWQGHNYVEVPQWEWAADRAELDASTGLVSTKTYRWSAETLQPWNMLLDGRLAIAKYLGWLYERRGQYSPFWMPTFKQDLLPLGRQGTQLMVKGHEYSNLYASADNRLDLAFVYFDNTYICARIIDLVVGDGVDLLYLDITVPAFTNLRWLSFLRRVVLSSDDLELAWETDNKMQVAFAVVDAPLDWDAGSPSVSPSPSPSGSPTPSPSASLSGSRSPSHSVSPSASASPST